MVKIKTPEEIEIMAENGIILAGVIKELEKEIRPGIATKELDRVAEALILKSGAKCSFKGYQGFPSCLCSSINEEIVHAVPSQKKLKEGDLISLDLGLFRNGYHSDMAVTLCLGKTAPEVLKLVRTAKIALEKGIRKIKPGNKIGDIGYAIQEYIESQGFSVVRELCGHGIGRKIHEDPQVLNYGRQKTGIEIKEGMVLCLEPMVTAGDWRIRKSKDGHCYKTKDNSLSAHFEHTVAVLKNGAKILTVVK